jgi:hypothetical protein
MNCKNNKSEQKQEEDLSYEIPRSGLHMGGEFVDEPHDAFVSLIGRRTLKGRFPDEKLVAQDAQRPMIHLQSHAYGNEEIKIGPARRAPGW